MKSVLARLEADRVHHASLEKAAQLTNLNAGGIHNVDVPISPSVANIILLRLYIKGNDYYISKPFHSSHARPSGTHRMRSTLKWN